MAVTNTKLSTPRIPSYHRSSMPVSRRAATSCDGASTVITPVLVRSKSSNSANLLMYVQYPLSITIVVAVVRGICCEALWRSACFEEVQSRSCETIRVSSKISKIELIEG